MPDVADLLADQGTRYAVDGAMAAAVHGVVRANLVADDVVTLQVREPADLRHSFFAVRHDPGALSTQFMMNRCWGILSLGASMSA